jgi:hypothetical protein
MIKNKLLIMIILILAGGGQDGRTSFYRPGCIGSTPPTLVFDKFYLLSIVINGLVYNPT